VEADVAPDRGVDLLRFRHLARSRSSINKLIDKFSIVEYTTVY
jgi:hypothetical protein